MLRQAALAWWQWQCASRILCHHANAARRSTQLSSTLGVGNRAPRRLPACFLTQSAPTSTRPQSGTTSLVRSSCRPLQGGRLPGSRIQDRRVGETEKRFACPGTHIESFPRTDQHLRTEVRGQWYSAWPKRSGSEVHMRVARAS